jgi:xanthine dehydrogenase YagR molybdenum-binding subunit
VIAPFVGGGFGGKAVLVEHRIGRRRRKQAPGSWRCPAKVFRIVGGRTVAEQRVAIGATRVGHLTVIHTGLTVTPSTHASDSAFPTRHLYATFSLRCATRRHARHGRQHDARPRRVDRHLRG